MRKDKRMVASLVWMLLILPAITFPSGSSAPATQRPIELADIAAWRSARSATLSNDGQWFAYRVGPREGTAK